MSSLEDSLLTLDLFTDTAAIPDSSVSDIYYGMFRGKIHTNLPFWESYDNYLIKFKMATITVKRSIVYGFSLNNGHISYLDYMDFTLV